MGLVLGGLTIGYNLLEGLAATILGAQDETLALFGFGVDSFVEVVSGVGIVHMLLRSGPVAGADPGGRDRFERTALRITGVCFYILALGLVAGAGLALAIGRAPTTTVWGVVIGSLSLASMWALYAAKRRTGRLLSSAAMISDANCTKACIWLSGVLLASSLVYETTGIAWVDAVGSAVIAFYAFREGREAFEKARSESFCNDRCC